MAIVINHNPGTYFSAHDKILFTVFEAAKYGNDNYKYLCDVYIGGVLINRLVAYPDPTNGRGLFDISKVVRDYVAVNFNPTPSVIRAQEMGSGEFFIDVTCKFGEDDNGTIAADLTVDSARRYYNHYNSRLVGSNTILSNFLDKPLTNRPLTGNTVELTDNFCFIPYLPTDTDNVTVEIKTYASGSLVATNNATVYAPAAANTLQLFNVSPGAINATVGSSLINSGIEYYTVQFLNPNISDEPVYRFNIACNVKYTTYKLHFLNRFGGFETYPFRLVSRKTIDIEKKNYTQRDYSMDASGVISFYNSNNVYRGQKETFASTYSEKLKLTADFLTDQEYTWLSELVLSPLVYIEDNGYFVPVAISQNNYEFRKRVNDKLQPLSVEIEYGGTYNAQFR